MYGFGYSLYNRTPFLGGGGGFDPAAQAYFAATGITGVTQQTAINNLVKGLKTDGIWSKMKAVYPFVTDNRNLLGYTEQFENGYWQKYLTTVTANATTAPNGTSTADIVLDNATNDIHSIYVGQTVSAGTYTWSVYAKKQNLNYLYITAYTGAYNRTWFNLNNGTIGTNAAGNTAAIESIGNGWYRCSVSRTYTSGTFSYELGLSNADNVYQYAGNGTNGVYLWGAQLELGSLSTYQPIATTQQAFIASQFKFNLVNPVDSDAAFRLVFNGGWTHSSNGATPNGTNGYADTKFVPNTQLTLNSASFSAYSRNNFTPVIDQSWGCSSNSSNLPLFAQSFDPTKYIRSFMYSYLTPDAMISATGIDFSGLFTTTRTAANNAKLFRNTTQLAAVTTQAQTTQPTNNFFFGAFNGGPGISNYSNFQYAFAHIGNGLTDTEAANLYTRVQAYQTALSRNV
jgi:hypothetical protein